MGFYLERNSKKDVLPWNKAVGLLEDDGEFLSYAHYDGEWILDLICVVDNGPFTAAAWVFSKREMEEFQPSIRDLRPRCWIRYPHIREVLHSQRAYDEMREDFPNG